MLERRVDSQGITEVRHLSQGTPEFEELRHVPANANPIVSGRIGCFRERGFNLACCLMHLPANLQTDNNQT